MHGFSILTTVLVGILTLAVLHSTSAFSSVKVKLHDSATLHCNHTCSGLVTWTVSHKTRDILAQCDQTSCQSEEGFHMSHDQYLKGDLSLTITDVDYSKRTWYSCTCNSKDICDVSLRIDAPEISRNITPGESLTLHVPVSESVEVNFYQTNEANANPRKVCEVKGRELQCDPEYEKRVSFSSSLQMKDLKESDSGVYTIWDTKNEETVSIYRVTFRGTNTDTNKTVPEKGVEESWMDRNYQGLLTGLVGGLVLGLLTCYFVIPWGQRCCERICKRMQRFSRNHCPGCIGGGHSVDEETCDPPDPEGAPLRKMCVDAGSRG